jgi:hypothetical protein
MAARVHVDKTVIPAPHQQPHYRFLSLPPYAFTPLETLTVHMYLRLSKLALTSSARSASLHNNKPLLLRNMETLLSLAFDNISSKDSSKLRKGLRQIEGLLAQICLSQKITQGHNRRASVVPSPNDTVSTPKTLQDLPSDPAFREFFRLQDSFEYNGKSLRSNLWLRSKLTIWLQFLPD